MKVYKWAAFGQVGRCPPFQLECQVSKYGESWSFCAAKTASPWNEIAWTSCKILKHGVCVFTKSGFSVPHNFIYYFFFFDSIFKFFWVFGVTSTAAINKRYKNILESKFFTVQTKFFIKIISVSPLVSFWLNAIDRACRKTKQQPCEVIKVRKAQTQNPCLYFFLYKTWNFVTRIW